MARALILVVLWLLVSGCGGGERGNPGAVTFQLFGNAEELGLYRDIAKAYERSGGPSVRLVEVGDRDAHLTKLSTAFAAGNAPDVFLVNYRNFASYAARDVLDPAGPRLDRAGGLDRGDFFPQPLEAFEYQGELQCLPQNVSSLVVYYNRDALREAGLGDPPANWGFDDLQRYARRLTDPRSDRYGVALDPSVVRLAPFVWAAGGELVDDPDRPTRFTLDSTAAKIGLRAFLSLYGFRAAPPEEVADALAAEDLFARGRAAMFLSSRREVPVLRESADFDWDVAAFPRDRERASVLHSDAYCVARGAGAEAGWKFVEFAAGPVGQRLLARGGRIVPSLRSVAGSPDFLDPGSPPRGDRVFLDALPDLRRLPVAPAWPEIEDAADLAIKRAFYEELDEDAAIARIRGETDPLFRRAVR